MARSLRAPQFRATARVAMHNLAMPWRRISDAVFSARHGARAFYGPNDGEAAIALVRRMFHLPPDTAIATLGSGLNCVLRIATSPPAIARLAGDAQQAALFAIEHAVLEALPDSLAGVAIPRPDFHRAGRPAILRYPELPGEALHPSDLQAQARARLAEDLGRFVAALQRIEVPARLAPLLRRPPEQRSAAMLPEALAEFPAPAFPQGSLARIAQACACYRANAGGVGEEKLVLAHDDLKPGNLLVERASGALLGVIDFSLVSLRSPARDFRWWAGFDPAFGALVLAAYGRAGGIGFAPERLAMIEGLGLGHFMLQALQSGNPGFIAMARERLEIWMADAPRPRS